MVDQHLEGSSFYESLWRRLELTRAPWVFEDMRAPNRHQFDGRVWHKSGGPVKVEAWWDVEVRWSWYGRETLVVYCRTSCREGIWSSGVIARGGVQ